MSTLKEKMAAKKVKRLEQMGITDCEICEGLTIHSKPFIKTLRKMEMYFNLSSSEFNRLDFTKINTLLMLIYFLARQRWEYLVSQGVLEDPEITEDYIEDIFEYLSSEQGGLDIILENIMGMLGVDIDIQETTSSKVIDTPDAATDTSEKKSPEKT